MSKTTSSGKLKAISGLVMPRTCELLVRRDVFETLTSQLETKPSLKTILEGGEPTLYTQAYSWIDTKTFNGIRGRPKEYPKSLRPHKQNHNQPLE